MNGAKYTNVALTGPRQIGSHLSVDACRLARQITFRPQEECPQNEASAAGCSYEQPATDHRQKVSALFRQVVPV